MRNPAQKKRSDVSKLRRCYESNVCHIADPVLCCYQTKPALISKLYKKLDSKTSYTHQTSVITGACPSQGPQGLTLISVVILQTPIWPWKSSQVTNSKTEWLIAGLTKTIHWANTGRVKRSDHGRNIRCAQNEKPFFELWVQLYPPGPRQTDGFDLFCLICKSCMEDNKLTVENKQGIGTEINTNGK